MTDDSKKPPPAPKPRPPRPNPDALQEVHGGLGGDGDKKR